MAGSHKSVRTKVKGWEALDSNNGKGNLWFFFILANTTSIMFMTVIRDITRCKNLLQSINNRITKTWVPKFSQVIQIPSKRAMTENKEG